MECPADGEQAGHRCAHGDPGPEQQAAEATQHELKGLMAAADLQSARVAELESEHASAQRELAEMEKHQANAASTGASARAAAEQELATVRGNCQPMQRSWQRRLAVWLRWSSGMLL